MLNEVKADVTAEDYMRAEYVIEEIQLTKASYVTGSRVMGGGFGGCTINLVKADKYDAFVKKAFAEYAKKFGHEPKLYNVVISDGARRAE